MCIPTKTLQRFQRDLEARGFCSNTIATYQRCVRRFVGQLERAPSRARESDVRDYVICLRQRYAARSVNVHIAALRCFYSDTLRRPELFRRVRRVRVQSSPVTILSGTEVLRLLEATRSPKYRALILLMYGAGLRIGEALTRGKASSYMWVSRGRSALHQGDAFPGVLGGRAAAAQGF